jgi:hypothetical protein
MIVRLFSFTSYSSFTSFTSFHLPASISTMASLQRSQKVARQRPARAGVPAASCDRLSL